MTTRRLAAILAADMLGFSRLVWRRRSGDAGCPPVVRKEIVPLVLPSMMGASSLTGEGNMPQLAEA
jgi:hypothetical protein